MRILSLTIAALLALAGGLQAQIAAPRLNPTIPVSISAFNPAVLSWGGPSRFGGGLFDVDRTVTQGGVSQLFASGDGTMAQVRLVGEDFAFHAELISISMPLDPAIGVGSLDIDNSFVGVSYQAGEVFSIGVGMQRDEVSFPGGSEESSLPMVGGTLRLGETVFFGAAFGTETFSESPGGEVDHTVFRAGAAVHFRDQDSGYHLEAYIEDANSEIDAASGTEVDKEEAVGITAEVVFGGGFLVGLEIVNADSTSPGAASPDGETEDTTISVGWAGSEGLAVTLSLIENEDTDVATGDTATFEATLLSVAWLF